MFLTGRISAVLHEGTDSWIQPSRKNETLIVLDGKEDIPGKGKKYEQKYQGGTIIGAFEGRQVNQFYKSLRFVWWYKR